MEYKILEMADSFFLHAYNVELYIALPSAGWAAEKLFSSFEFFNQAWSVRNQNLQQQQFPKIL